MSVCKKCEGTGKLGFQREGCCYCDGEGYIKEKIILDKQIVESGLNKLVERQLKIIEELNRGGAYTEHECKERLELIEERELIDYMLEYLFNLQSFKYTKPDYGGIVISD